MNTKIKVLKSTHLGIMLENMRLKHNSEEIDKMNYKILLK
jgi:hypothetical protein